MNIAIPQIKYWPSWKAAANIASFEKNPEKGGIPEIAITPIKNVVAIIGNDALCCAILKIFC